MSVVEEERLIIGLGNPGASYAKTRHNVGFNVVKAFAEKNNFVVRPVQQVTGLLAHRPMGNKKVLLLMPTTYMNESGQAARRCIDYFKVPIHQLIIVCDDVALPVGTMRLRIKGSSGGHNGLKSITTHLGTENYARLRIGVGSPAHESLEDYVLGNFTKEESSLIEEIIVRAVDVLELWITSGIVAAERAANAKKDEKKNSGDKTNG